MSSQLLRDLDSRFLQRCLDSLPCSAMLALTNIGYRWSSTLESSIERVVWFSGNDVSGFDTVLFLLFVENGLFSFSHLLLLYLLSSEGRKVDG
ncbi:hypothetical protein L873DRAFT_1807464 [Choiromyces venosus 120613-1]|uniref:Uncharacterized protein n=1 Tax=Choiromyces venosus 120613-1 TaxID=1336337 RepID=A0A3N4JLE1_9PEZI|nr:hypothetical protein L873DRAFT_1807464 [Choiromyces venosus 120613-1]